MAVLIVLPFAVFFGCVLTMIWTHYRIRRVLVERHPDEWLRISKSANFLVQQPGYWFPFTGRHRELNDPDLSALVMRVRWLQGIGIAVWLIIVAALATGSGFS